MTETQNPTPQQVETGITLVDLANMLQIVDLASTRGAFRAAELEPVGQLFNKFKRFVDAANANAEAQQPQQSVEIAPPDGATVNG